MKRPARVRVAVGLVSLVGCSAAALASRPLSRPVGAGEPYALDEDDPRLARGLRTLDEDDPKLARGEGRRPIAPLPPATARVAVSYRRIGLTGPDGQNVFFNAGQFDYYPWSGYVRFGMSGEFGYGGGPFKLWYFATGPTIALQLPGRVTPFVEGRFSAGFLGASIEGLRAVTTLYLAGIEAGVELFLTRQVYLSVALGFTHGTYRSIDANAYRAHPSHYDPAQRTFVGDSFAIKVGLGL